MVDVGLVGGKSVGVTEFRGVKEDAMGRRGGVRGEGGPAGAGNQEGGEDSLVIVEEEVGVAKHVAGVEEVEVGSGEENIVGDGIREAGGGGPDTCVGDVAWGGEGEPSVENEGGCVGGEGEKVAPTPSDAINTSLAGLVDRVCRKVTLPQSAPSFAWGAPGLER